MAREKVGKSTLMVQEQPETGFPLGFVPGASALIPGASDFARVFMIKLFCTPYPPPLKMREIYPLDT